MLYFTMIYNMFGRDLISNHDQIMQTSACQNLIPVPCWNWIIFSLCPSTSNHVMCSFITELVVYVNHQTTLYWTISNKDWVSLDNIWYKYFIDICLVLCHLDGQYICLLTPKTYWLMLIDLHIWSSLNTNFTLIFFPWKLFLLFLLVTFFDRSR